MLAAFFFTHFTSLQLIEPIHNRVTYAHVTRESPCGLMIYYLCSGGITLCGNTKSSILTLFPITNKRALSRGFFVCEQCAVTSIVAYT